MTNRRQVLILNGPNLNCLGRREPAIYGSETLEEIIEYTNQRIKALNIELLWFQSNIEGELVERIQWASTQELLGLVINPAAYSHTSVAILDALKLFEGPIAEVHLSNTHRREEFRQVKLTAKASTIIMEGLGKDSYYFGVLSLLDIGRNK